jgi:farnesyl diphosphate synthase
MDNDVLRRGRATAHVKFGEAMAILAGDALLTRAFGLLGEGALSAPSAGAKVALLVAKLAQGAGENGMIAGQVADMDLCEVPAGVEGLRYIHSRKTAALIRASVCMGAICGGATPAQLEAVSEYGRQMGMVFQLVDDLLDATGEAATLGKTPGKDASSGKRTHLSHMSAGEAWNLAGQWTDQAIEALSPLGERADKLARLAALLAQRTH